MNVNLKWEMHDMHVESFNINFEYKIVEIIK